MRLHWLNQVVIKYKQPIRTKERIVKYYVSKYGVKNCINLAKKEGAIKKIYILN